MTSLPDPSPKLRMVVLFAVADDSVTDTVLQADTAGYLLSSDDPDTLMRTLRQVAAGKAGLDPQLARRVNLRVSDAATPATAPIAHLSPREKEVLRALVDGLSYKMIADQLTISFETVRSHIKRIYEKLHVHNNTEAVAKTLRFGLLT